MWKKASVAIALSLTMVPSVALTADSQFDPFAGILEGIAQGMAAGSDFSVESNYDGGVTSEGSMQGGNVIIGSPIEAHRQNITVDGQADLTINGGSARQGLNINAHDGEVPVLIMQGAAINQGVFIASSSSEGSVQSVNLVTR
jgi:hypothetical protein